MSTRGQKFSDRGKAEDAAARWFSLRRPVSGGAQLEGGSAAITERRGFLPSPRSKVERSETPSFFESAPTDGGTTDTEPCREGPRGAVASNKEGR